MNTLDYQPRRVRPPSRLVRLLVPATGILLSLYVAIASVVVSINVRRPDYNGPFADDGLIYIQMPMVLGFAAIFWGFSVRWRRAPRLGAAAFVLGTVVWIVCLLCLPPL